jgi:hypothetical protein
MVWLYERTQEEKQEKGHKGVLEAVNTRKYQMTE